jgi:hypothetical protein
MSAKRIRSSWVAVALALGVACAAITGCVAKGGDLPTAPTRAVSGFFTLQEVNGAAVPALSAPQPPNACPGFLDSGRLILSVDPQTYEISTSTHFDCGNGAGPRFVNDVETGTWTLDGGPETFTVTFTSGSGAIYNLTTGTASIVIVTLRMNAPHQDAGRPAFAVNTKWRRF